jgi:hypothetical protein
MPSALSTVGAAAWASARTARDSDQVTTNTALASAVKNNPSAAIEKHAAISAPSTRPLRSQWPGSRNFSTHQISSGATQEDVKLRCPFACEMKPGAKPANNPPIMAATRRRTRKRSRNRYQAKAEPARLSVRIVTNEICGPASTVSGANSTA